ncbi:MAG: hypothetical protein LC785_14135 [Acidobacteria bacterium]|nr:hypothetical protein [Acidobacteriota bacterium]
MRSKIPTRPNEPAMVSNRLPIVLSAILLALLWSFPSRAQKMNKQSYSQSTIDEKCIANLERIDELIKLYLHHSAGVLGFPSSLDKVHLMSKDPSLFICPGDERIKPSVKTDTFRTSYEIVNNPLKPKFSATPANRIAIIAEKRPNHDGKRFVLFYDGSVRAFDNAQFAELQNNNFVDIQLVDKNH